MPVHRRILTADVPVKIVQLPYFHALIAIYWGVKVNEEYVVNPQNNLSISRIAVITRYTFYFNLAVLSWESL